MKGTKLKPIRPGAAIMYTPNVEEHRQRQYCVYYQMNADICRKVYVHNNCNCNEMVAVRNRVIFDCPRPTKLRVRQCKLIARLIADWIPREHRMRGEWIAVYSGRKRRKYEQAAMDVELDGLKRSDGYVSAFVKAEKIFELKDPRLIQARSAKYNYALGNYLKPIEHHLYNLKGTGRLSKFLPRSRLIAKGCNMQRRAGLIAKKMSKFSKPLVISLDASRFDAHVTDMLRVEHLIYQRYWKDPQLDRLLAYQWKNRCRTSTGIRYKVTGSRMSGDMNTALGNCVISVVLLANIMHSLKITPNLWDMLCDGDDCLLFIDESHRELLQSLPELYLQHGMQIKVENVTSELSRIVFCQTSPIRTVMGLKMVSNPTRTLSRSLVGCRHWAEPKFVPQYLYLIGYCELALNMGVPVLQQFALMVLSWGSRLPRHVQMSGRVIKALREERAHPIMPLPISDDARLDFWDAFGIPPVEQLALEGAMRVLSRHGSQEETGAWARSAQAPTPPNTANHAPSLKAAVQARPTPKPRTGQG